ncbi:transposable element Tcb2 transposase [Trichonephila clavipes]|nr:transposable element Tcb2 transposase [Trichonephila clavipes]
MTGHFYRYVILEQHVRLFRGAMGAEFLFMDDNARPQKVQTLKTNAFNRRISPSMDRLAYSPDLNPIEHVLGYAWPIEFQPVNSLPPIYRNFRGHCLMSGVIFPKIRLIDLILSMPRRCKACIASSGRHAPY